VLRSTALESVRQLTRERDSVVADKAKAVAPFDRRLAEIDEQMIVACREVAGLGGTPDVADEEVSGDPAEVSGPVTDGKMMRKADRLMHMIAETQQLDYGKVATELYGEDSEKSRARLSSMLSTLHTEGRIRRLGRNRWEVVAR